MLGKGSFLVLFLERVQTVIRSEKDRYSELVRGVMLYKKESRPVQVKNSMGPARDKSDSSVMLGLRTGTLLRNFRKD